MLFDTDVGFGYDGSSGASVNMMKKAYSAGNIGIIFTALMKNEGFRNAFSNRFNHHLENTFKPESVIEKINAMQAVIAPEMPEHIDRWRYPGSVQQWNRYVHVMRDFAKTRNREFDIYRQAPEH